MRWLWISLLVVVVDQATKLAADAWLAYHRPVAVAPMFNLTLSYNRGAAFSFLADAGGWQRWFFLALAGVISAVLVAWMRRLSPRQRITGMALALVLGGAVGNLIDRAVYGHVIDFLDVYYERWHWPTFNVADSAITLGVALLFFGALRGEGNEDRGR